MNCWKLKNIYNIPNHVLPAYEKRLVEKFVYAETENICSLLIFRDYIPFDWLALARYTVNNSQSKAQGFTELSQRNGDKLL